MYGNLVQQVVVASSAIIMLKKRKQERQHWVHPYLMRREEGSMHQNIFLELYLEDPMRFRRALRMDLDTFQYLLCKVKSKIEKKNTSMRKRISAEERLSLTLRFLASGETQEDLRAQFRIGQSTISGILREVCEAIYSELKDEYLRFPSERDWIQIAQDFGDLWQFFNCIGCLDGKHCRIQSPLKSGSTFYNYKDFKSIVLFAMVDAHLRFTYVDVGLNGRISDSGIWNVCSLKNALEMGSLRLPPPQKLPGSTVNFPFVIVGDSIFPLGRHMMVPYPQVQLHYRDDRRIFNYRLSRARRCVENAFGILAARFQIFRSAMACDPDVASMRVMACCALHNMLRSRNIGQSMYVTDEFIDVEDTNAGTIRPGEYRQEPVSGLLSLNQQGGNRHPDDAIDLRNAWCEYFNSIEGAVPWQNNMIRRIS